MNLEEFFSKYKASDRDVKIVKSLYNSEKRTEQQWVDLLSSKIVFSKRITKKQEVKAKIEAKKKNQNSKEVTKKTSKKNTKNTK